MKQEQQNFLNLINKTADPSIMAIDIEGNEKKQAARRAEMDKLNPPAKIAPKIEYNQLQSRLFALNQDCKAFAVRVNQWAGAIHQLEGRIADLLKHKKKAAEEGNVRGERSYEHQVELLEDELADANIKLQGALSQNAGAIRALKAFNGHERIKELKKELGL